MKKTIQKISLCFGILGFITSYLNTQPISLACLVDPQTDTSVYLVGNAYKSDNPSESQNAFLEFLTTLNENINPQDNVLVLWQDISSCYPTSNDSNLIQASWMMQTLQALERLSLSGIALQKIDHLNRIFVEVHQALLSSLNSNISPLNVLSIETKKMAIYDFTQCARDIVYGNTALRINLDLLALENQRYDLLNMSYINNINAFRAYYATYFEPYFDLTIENWVNKKVFGEDLILALQTFIETYLQPTFDYNALYTIATSPGKRIIVYAEQAHCSAIALQLQSLDFNLQRSITNQGNELMPEIWTGLAHDLMPKKLKSRKKIQSIDLEDAREKTLISSKNRCCWSSH